MNTAIVVTEVATSVVNETVTEIMTATTNSTIEEPTSTPEINEYEKHPNVEKASHINNLTMPFVLYLLGGLLLFLGFCILRNRFKIFYMPRRRLKRCAPPRIPSGFFSWIMVVLRLKTSYALPIVGVDAEVFLLFLKMAMKLFLTIGIMGLVILVPVNYLGRKHANIANISELSGSMNETSQDIKLLEKITIDNIPEQSSLLYIHAAFSWIFSITSYIFLFKYYNKCREIRMKYISNCYNNNYKQLINFRSIMIFGLPREYRDEERLYTFFADLGIGDIESVVICKRYYHLRKALDNRQHYLNKIESYYTHWIGYKIDDKKKKKNSDKESKRSYQKINESQDKNDGGSTSHFKKMSEERTDTENSLFSIVNSAYSSSTSNLNEVPEPRYDQLLIENKKDYKKRLYGRLYIFGDKIDLLNHYVEKFIKWDNNVKKLRKKTNNSTTPVAFVTFKSPLSALIGSQCLLHEKPFTCFVSLAPEPRDIFWKNISNRLANPYTKLMRAVVVVMISIFIVIIWFIPITFIISIANLKSMENLIPAIGKVTNSLPNIVEELINNVLSMIILATWLSFLPDILMFLSEIQGIETYSWLEQALLKKYHFYQIFNVIFIFIIGNVLIQFILLFNKGGIGKMWSDINKKPTDILKMFATYLIKMSPFYINYLMLQTFVIVGLQLIYPAPITKPLFAWILKLIKIRKTPRTYSNLSDPRTFSLNYGYISTLPLVLFAVTLTFSCICPIIPFLGTLYFAYNLLVYKYQILYIQHPRYESYGEFVPLYINRCLFAIIIFQITMFGILSIKFSVENYNDSTSGPSFAGIKVVLYMVPLLLSTFFVYWWFKQSFEKHFKFIPLEVVAKRLNYDNCIINSNAASARTANSEFNFPQCSYCGSHDINSLKTPVTKPQNEPSGPTKDISSALRRRASFERSNSNSELFSSNSNNNNSKNSSPSTLNVNGFKQNLTYENKNFSYSDMQEYASAFVSSNPLSNVNKKLNNKQNQIGKSPLGKGKHSSTMLQNDESSSSSSNMPMPTINVDPSYCNTDDQNNSNNPNTSSSTSKPKDLLPRLNTNLRNNYLYAPTPLSARSLGQNSSDDATDVYINSPQTLYDLDTRSPYDSPATVNPNNYYYSSNHNSGRPILYDKRSSRRWIFDEYTDYHEPTCERVNGVCDVPWDVYQLNGGYLNIDDKQLYCYEHPAVIGHLPTLWLPNKMNQGKARTEDIMNRLINEYKRVHTNELHIFDNENEEFNVEHIAEEIECDNDHPQWVNNIKRRIYHCKKKFSEFYDKSMQRYVDYIVQWLNFGLR